MMEAGRYHHELKPNGATTRNGCTETIARPSQRHLLPAHVNQGNMKLFRVIDAGLEVLEVEPRVTIHSPFRARN